MAVIDPYGMNNPSQGVKMFEQGPDESLAEFEKRLTRFLLKNKTRLRIYARDAWIIKDKQWRINLWYYRDT